MKAVRLGLVVCLALMFASCSLKPTWDMIGKWQKTEGEETLEFSRNGTLTVTGTKGSVTVPYKFGDTKHLQIEVGSLGTLVAEVTLVKDTLTLTDSNGNVSTFKKVK